MANLYGLSDTLLGEGIYKSDPVGNFNFILTVEGMYDIPLKAVRSFQKVNQYERIKEGGVNDYVHLKRAPIQDAHTIQFERYVSGTLLDPLANGAELAIPVILWLKRAANNGLTDVRVDQMKNGANSTKTYSNDDYDTSSVRLYIFTGCVVMSKEYGALDAEKSGLATEVVTMAYKELYIVPNLYTFFGGGTDLKSLGKTGELTSVDEKAREDFLTQQKKDHDAALKAHQDAAKDADEKQKAERTSFETKQSEDHDAALKAHQEAAKEANAKQKAEAASFLTRRKIEHDIEERIHQDAAKDANKEQQKQRKEFEEKQQKEYDAAVEAHKEAAKKAEEQAKKDHDDWEEKRSVTPEEAREQRAKANAEQSSLEKANQIRNKAKRNTKK